MLPKITINMEVLETEEPIRPEWQIEHVLSSPTYRVGLRFNGKTAEQSEADLSRYTSDWAYNKCALFVQLTQAALATESKGYPVFMYSYSQELHKHFFSIKRPVIREWRFAHVPIIPIPLIDTIASWGHEPIFWTCIQEDKFIEMPSEADEIPVEDIQNLFAKGIIKYWMCQVIEDYEMLIHYPSKSLDDLRRILDSTLIEAQ